MAAAPQKPETFMLSTEAQQALPHDAQVALQQVDNCTLISISCPPLYGPLRRAGENPPCIQCD